MLSTFKGKETQEKEFKYFAHITVYKKQKQETQISQTQAQSSFQNTDLPFAAGPGQKEV